MKNVNTLLQDAKDILDDLNIPYGTIYQVTVNSRATGRWGRCTRHPRYNNYTIEISSRLLKDDVSYEAAMDTMIHELLHAYKNRMCHTGDWKKCANIVNTNYPQYNIKRCTSAEEKGITLNVSAYKFKITCKTCGVVSYTKRETKVVKLLKRGSTACTCRKCNGHTFKVEEI